MRCLGKVGSPLESKPGNQLSSQDDLQYIELLASCCAELRFLYTRDSVLWESLELPKGSQTTCPVWCGMQDGSGVNAWESGLISN